MVSLEKGIRNWISGITSMIMGSAEMTIKKETCAAVDRKLILKDIVYDFSPKRSGIVSFDTSSAAVRRFHP